MSTMATETRAEAFAAVETWPDAAILQAIAVGQAQAIAACQAAIGAIGDAASLLAATWRRGGRIGTAGSGSSGLIALLDALELPVTYGLAAERLPVIMAGGAASLHTLDQGAEDNVSAAALAVAQSGLRAGDAMLATSASGATPFTLAAAEAAKARGVAIIAIVCNGAAPLLALADVGVLLATGPEIVAGSTRMNAGTAQKCALNMISTLTAIRLHHVHQGMMVNLRAENAKLRERAALMVALASGADLDAARQHLHAASFMVKPAILMAGGASLDQAHALLEVTDGDVRLALRMLHPAPSSHPM
jgi:N-acetylmuramic acid 6-phosphate etherase